MKNIDDFLDAVKLKTGSDYRTGKLINVVAQHFSNWRGRRSMPSNKHIIEMCKIAGLDVGEAIIAVEYSRENERPLREAGFIDLGVLGVLSAGSFGAMSILELTSLPYEAIGTAMLGASIVYYVKSEEYVLLEIKGQLRTLNDQELSYLVCANDIEACQVSAYSIN